MKLDNISGSIPDERDYAGALLAED